MFQLWVSLCSTGRPGTHCIPLSLCRPGLCNCKDALCLGYEFHCVTQVGQVHIASHSHCVGLDCVTARTHCVPVSLCNIGTGMW